jgi:hypothetical protein
MGQLVLNNLTPWFIGRRPLTPMPEAPPPSAAAFNAMGLRGSGGQLSHDCLRVDARNTKRGMKHAYRVATHSG